MLVVYTCMHEYLYVCNFTALAYRALHFVRKFNHSSFSLPLLFLLPAKSIMREGGAKSA